MRSPDVVVIEHEDDCPPGVLTEVLEAADLAIHRVRPHRGDLLPRSLTNVEGFVVLGGGMSAMDDADHPWLAPTRALLREAVDRRIPTLAVCLGAQLAAIALEGRVERLETPEVGFIAPELTDHAAQDPVLSVLGDPPQPVLQWHQDAVHTAPPGSRVLARGPERSVQAFCTGGVLWGVQFHPKATAPIVRRWAETSDLLPKGATPDTAEREFRAAREATATARKLLTAWSEQVAPRR